MNNYNGHLKNYLALHLFDEKIIILFWYREFIRLANQETHMCGCLHLPETEESMFKHMV